MKTIAEKLDETTRQRAKTLEIPLCESATVMEQWLKSWGKKQEKDPPV